MTDHDIDDEFRRRPKVGVGPAGVARAGDLLFPDEATITAAGGGSYERTEGGWDFVGFDDSRTPLERQV